MQSDSLLRDALKISLALSHPAMIANLSVQDEKVYHDFTKGYIKQLIEQIIVPEVTSNPQKSRLNK